MSTQNRSESNPTLTERSATERVTFRLPESQLEALEALAEQGEYPNRSEAIRCAVRQLLEDGDEA
jgi:Arc/MetJ-type ribon-helix-helix transcriptional regulator